MYFDIKFFGSLEERKQIHQVKMKIKADSRENVIDELKKMGYKVINSLKIK